MLALFLSQRTARTVGVPPGQAWNLCVLALCAALAASRLLQIAFDWTILRLHPSWTPGLDRIQPPLLAAFAALAAGVVAAAFTLWKRMPLADTADALTAPLALGLAFEQAGALLAGSGYGTEAGRGIASHWAVTYTNPFAALWSGTPLGLALHPVQAYAALGFLTLSLFLFFRMPYRRQAGEAAGLFLLGAGVTVYFTEFWRDPEGRGLLLGGAIDGPQLAAIFLVLAGGLALLEPPATAAWQEPWAGARQDVSGVETNFPIDDRKDEAANE